MSERSDGLLKAAAAAFRDGRSPFSTDWLVEHDVSVDECVLLGDAIATSIENQLVARNVLREMVKSARK